MTGEEGRLVERAEGLTVEFSPLEGLVGAPVPFGTTWMVRGGPGTGKTTLAFQFALQGLRKGESAIYVACDEPPERIVRNAESFGFGVAAYERMGRFLVVDAFSPHPRGGMHVSDRSDPEEFVYVLRRALSEVGRPCRVIVDSMASLLANLPPRELVALAYEKNRTLRAPDVVLLDVYLTSAVEAANVYALSNAYDVEIDLYMAEEVAGIPKRFLRIRKLRGGTYDPRPFPFTIRPQQGVVVNERYYEE